MSDPRNAQIKAKSLLLWSRGYYEDIDGVKWDIVGVIGIGETPYVQARRISQYSTYYGTGTYDHQGGFHTWLPYEVEVVENDI